MYSDIEKDVMSEFAADQQDGARKKAWLVTFTDLVSLMLTFFVLLFSMSSVQVDRWEEMIDTLSRTLNPNKEEAVSAPTAQYNISTVFRRRAINLDYLEAVLADKMFADDILQQARLFLGEDRLIISLPGDLFFQPGNAILSEKAKQALFVLGGILRNVNNQVGVNGHTDPKPVSGGKYTSNWELSLGRAIAVANSLKRAGYTDDIIAYGYSDSRYLSLPAGLTEERRDKLARRVDIVVMATGVKS